MEKKPRRFQLVISLDRKLLRPVIGVALLATLALALSSETLRLTTSYPAPAGIYNQIITTGNAGTGPADTVLARNAGNVVLAPRNTNGTGRVGVGTATPQAQLDVAGDARISGVLLLSSRTSQPFACDSAHDGSLAMSSLYWACVCRPGAGWVVLGNSGPCAWRCSASGDSCAIAPCCSGLSCSVRGGSAVCR